MSEKMIYLISVNAMSKNPYEGPREYAFSSQSEADKTKPLILADIIREYVNDKDTLEELERVTKNMTVEEACDYIIRRLADCCDIHVREDFTNLDQFCGTPTKDLKECPRGGDVMYWKGNNLVNHEEPMDIGR